VEATGLENKKELNGKAGVIGADPEDPSKPKVAEQEDKSSADKSGQGVPYNAYQVRFDAS